MDRLTVLVDGEWQEDHSRDEKKGFKNGKRACMTRLAEYENTKLLPEGVERLKRNDNRLKEITKLAIENIEPCCEICKHRRIQGDKTNCVRGNICVGAGIEWSGFEWELTEVAKELGVDI